MSGRVRCGECGRYAMHGEAITPGADTWWTLLAPWQVGVRAGRMDAEYACSLPCLLKIIETLKVPYEEVEDDLMTHPGHIEDGGAD